MDEILTGRYQIIQRLGRGTFGQTFLAKDIHLPKHPFCVVKLLKPNLNNETGLEVAKRFFDREAEMLYKLGEHPQIPRLLAHFEENGEFYLVQEYIEGETLAQELDKGNLWTEEAIITLIRDLLRVLAFVHQSQVIHRDIKPANIIRRKRDREIVLIDFGAVKQVRSQGDSDLTVVIGTPGYMPPEQQAFKPQFSSDIYAAGILAFQALSRLSPSQFPYDKTGEIYAHLFDLSISISPELTDFLERMVRYDYRQRYTDATEALQALKHLDFNLDRERSPTQATLATIATTNAIANSEKTEFIFPKTEPPTELPPEYNDFLNTPTLSREESRNRQILLNKVTNYWIKGVLETSLHGKALIELGLEERLDAVDRPWGLIWESSDTPYQSLASGIRIINKFDELGAGRTLLILGQPGSGKTTTLLELTRDLITRANRDPSLPIPVIFNLSSWGDRKRTISQWIVEELNTKYQVAKGIGRKWIEQQQLLLLLDGLDEVNIEKRQSCIESLNQFCTEFGQTEVIACSRIRDYENLSSQLCFQSAIYLQPLTPDQIQNYLQTMGESFSALKITLQTDETLQELAQSPLMLSIMTLTYQDTPLEDTPPRSIEEQRNHLFQAYIERMFNRRGNNNNYSKKQAKKWLSQLAKQMEKSSQTVFLLERIQPNWLKKKRHRIIYLMSLIITYFLIAGLFFNVFLPLDKLIVTLLVGAGLSWSIFGIYRVQPIEALKWSWKRGRDNLLIGTVLGAVLGTTIRILYEGLTSPLHWHIFNLTWLQTHQDIPLRGLVFGVSIGIMFGIVQGFKSPGIETITIPNQGIWQSAKSSLLFGSIGFIVFAIAADFVSWSIIFWGCFGLVFGLATGGGEACIKHLILRAILYFDGRIPWNYARFLNHATQLIFLQKVGGGYIFIHRLLLEYFAKIEYNKG
ncbi:MULTISPECIES: protein kinase [Spirulina sp. CCY15215]|uniref:protein kinase domain-containing protein n=1 Tax=Spirulina sp. CCY15215 TaxID=2767591 RepID=UPI00194F29AC|nr:protein kinase [Spirulina major]